MDKLKNAGKVKIKKSNEIIFKMIEITEILMANLNLIKKETAVNVESGLGL